MQRILTIGDAQLPVSESGEIRKETENERYVVYVGGNGDDLSVIDFAGDPKRMP